MTKDESIIKINNFYYTIKKYSNDHDIINFLTAMFFIESFETIERYIEARMKSLKKENKVFAKMQDKNIVFVNFCAILDSSIDIEFYQDYKDNRDGYAHGNTEKQEYKFIDAESVVEKIIELIDKLDKIKSSAQDNDKKLTNI